METLVCRATDPLHQQGNLSDGCRSICLASLQPDIPTVPNHQYTTSNAGFGPSARSCHDLRAI
eukprot:1160198-Pelagomonas_calceolata.AAC.5